MSNYRRVRITGGCYFFTVVTAKRRPIFDNESAVELLREAIRDEKRRRPFSVEAMVVLPDHLHCLWRLPEDDADFSERWRQIKQGFTRRYGQPVWQRSFWEHAIRDERDWQNHLDYIHFNPVRHGYAERASDWPWTSFRLWQARGFYADGWEADEPANVSVMNFE